MAMSPYVQNYDGEANTETRVDKNNDGESTSRAIRSERDATRRQLGLIILTRGISSILFFWPGPYGQDEIAWAACP